MRVKIKVYDNDNVPDGHNEDDAKDDGEDSGDQIVDYRPHSNLSGWFFYAFH